MDGLDLTYRKFHMRKVMTPLRLTRLSAMDWKDHKAFLLPFIAGVKSRLHQAMVMERCYERFENTFSWN